MLTRLRVAIRPAAARLSWLLVCGLLPLFGIYYVIAYVIPYRTPDFGVAYYRAAEALLAGESPYSSGAFFEIDGLVIDYVYPPLTAIATIPFTVLPPETAELVFVALLVVSFVLALALLGVRDWRCYGLAFIWPPVLEAIQTGNITMFLLLAAALVWRYRECPRAAGISLGVSLATKTLLWPLGLWFVATRRWRATTWTLSIAVATTVVTWGAISFRGFADYPDLVRRLSDRMSEQSYTVYALARDFGASPDLARVLWLSVAVSLAAAVVIVGRRGGERDAFILALSTTIAITPIVWIHYFVLLLVVVAVAEPRLGPGWFMGIPMQIFVTTGVYNGSTLQTAAMLATAVVTVVIALRSPSLRLAGEATVQPVVGRP